MHPCSLPFRCSWIILAHGSVYRSGLHYHFRNPSFHAASRERPFNGRIIPQLQLAFGSEIFSQGGVNIAPNSWPSNRWKRRCKLSASCSAQTAWNHHTIYIYLNGCISVPSIPIPIYIQYIQLLSFCHCCSRSQGAKECRGTNGKCKESFRLRVSFGRCN